MAAARPVARPHGLSDLDQEHEFRLERVRLSLTPPLTVSSGSAMAHKRTHESAHVRHLDGTGRVCARLNGQQRGVPS